MFFLIFYCNLVVVYVSPLYTEYIFYFAIYKSLVFLLLIHFQILYFSLPILFILCGVILSVSLFTCVEVWTLGVWGELACHKGLFNPPPQFSRLGMWCPAFVCVCMCMCVCVCVFGGLSIFFVFGWRVCVWWFGGEISGGGGGGGGGGGVGGLVLVLSLLSFI